MLSLSEVRVMSDSMLVGSKKVYLFSDRVLLVSPALHSLMATEDLEKLLAEVKVVLLPFPLTPSLEMNVYSNEW